MGRQPNAKPETGCHRRVKPCLHAEAPNRNGQGVQGHVGAGFPAGRCWESGAAGSVLSLRVGDRGSPARVAVSFICPFCCARSMRYGSACMAGPCGGDLQTCASRMGGEQAPPEVLQGMDPQARGHCQWWQCLQVLGLHLFSSRSPVKQAQPDRHAEELVHLQQQCGDLKQHLRDSAEESGRQAKNVKALEAKLRQSLAALADRDSEIAQLKEQAAARSNLDSSAAQVLIAQDPPAHAKSF